MIKSISFWLSMVSIVGCGFNMLKSPLSWLIWEITAVGFSLYFIKRKDYGSALVWLFYIPFDLIGYLMWKGTICF